MMCLRCDCEEFDIQKDAIFEQEYKGKTLWVKTPGVVCRECGWKTIGNEQINDLLKNTKKEYEKSYKNNSI